MTVPTHGANALHIAIAPHCRNTLQVFISPRDCTSSKAFNALILVPSSGYIFWNCSNLKSLFFPTMFEIVDNAFGFMFPFAS